MSAMPGNNWGEIFYNLLVIYLFLSLVLTCYSVIRMYIVKHFCNGVKYGKARIKQLTAQDVFVSCRSILWTRFMRIKTWELFV